MLWFNACLINFSRNNSVGKYLASIFYNAITTLFMVKCVLLMIKNKGQCCDSNIMKLLNLKGFFLFISNWSPKPFIQLKKNDKHYIYNVYTGFVERTFNIVKSTHIYAVDKLKILNITLFIVTHQIISRFFIDSADDRQWKIMRYSGSKDIQRINLIDLGLLCFPV